MKKGIFLLSALLVMASAAFAQVTAVQEGDVAKVTFTYTPDYDAGFVGLVGDFQGWNLDGATPMTQNDDGSWSVTLELPLDGELKYKFNVDGEWTEDPNAALTSDDGFGGLNGYVIVADVLAAGSGAAAAPAADRLFFGTYTSLRLRSWHPDDNGLMELAANSYLKFQGNILPDTPLFMEIQYMQGDVDIWAEADGDDALKGNAIGDLFFAAPYDLNDGGSEPLFGHFRVGVITEFVDATIYGRYAKTYQNQDYLFDVYREMDAWEGATELTKTLDLGGIDFNYFLGLSRRPNWSGGESGSPAAINAGTILRGLQSQFTATIGDYTAQVQYNAREVAAEEFEYILGNLNHQVALASSGPIVEGVDYTVQAITNFFNENAAEISGLPAWAIKLDAYDIAEEVVAGLELDMSFGPLSLPVFVSYAGDDIQMGYFFGRNDDDKSDYAMNNGYVVAQIGPSFEIMDGLTAGLDYTVFIDKDFETMGDGGKATNMDIDFDVAYDTLGLGLYAKTGLYQVNDDDSGFQFKEVGVSADINAIADIPSTSKVYAAYVNNFGGFVDNAFQVNTSEIHLISTNGLDFLLDGLAFNLGLLARLDGENTVTEDSEFGVSGGVSLRVPDWKSADVFFNFGYKAWLYDYDKDDNWAEGDRSSNIDIDNSKFSSSTDLGNKNLRFAFGIKWDF
jgi:hypothetical protein